jgi:hypothetical protein
MELPGLRETFKNAPLSDFDDGSDRIFFPIRAFGLPHGNSQPCPTEINKNDPRLSA